MKLSASAIEATNFLSPTVRATGATHDETAEGRKCGINHRVEARASLTEGGILVERQTDSGCRVFRPLQRLC